MPNNKLTSAASTNSTLVSASARRLLKLTAVNSTAAVKFVKVYDKATAPTVGTDVPVLNLRVPARGKIVAEFKDPLGFLLGIGFAITGLAVHTDTTAVGAADVRLDIGWSK